MTNFWSEILNLFGIFFYLRGIHKLRWQDFAFFDRLPPCIHIFEGMNINKKWTFSDHLATLSCKCSLWTPPNWNIFLFLIRRFCFIQLEPFNLSNLNVFSFLIGLYGKVILHTYFFLCFLSNWFYESGAALVRAKMVFQAKTLFSIFWIGWLIIDNIRL